MSAFTEVFGREPSCAWAAPGRVNLIGEHTDYNDGFVLPIALAHRVTCAGARNDTGRLRVHSVQQADGIVEIDVAGLRPGGVDGWAAYAAGVVWALRAAGHDVTGADLVIDGDVPAGAGLSSSAAVECAVALTLVDLFGLDLDRAETARLAQRAENEFVGMPCGLMDQSASLLCREGHALFLDTRSGETAHVPLDLDAHGLALLVVDTRAPHRLVEGEYAARRRDCEEAARALGVAALRDVDLATLDGTLASLDDDVLRRRVRHVVTENARVHAVVERLHAGRVRGIGRLLTNSHRSLRDDFEVTVPELDTAVACSLEAGAHGARMTGGGFGGCVIALVDAESTERVAATIARAFHDRGFGVPATFVTHAAAGAERVG